MNSGRVLRWARIRAGGPNISLTRSDMRTVKRIEGDGNCPFRAFSYLITGSESQHMAVRLNHMINIAHLILDHHVPVSKTTLLIKTWTNTLLGALILRR